MRMVMWVCENDNVLINIAARNASVPPAKAVSVTLFLHFSPLHRLLLVVYGHLARDGHNAATNSTLQCSPVLFFVAFFVGFFCLVHCRFFASEWHILHLRKPR